MEYFLLSPDSASILLMVNRTISEIKRMKTSPLTVDGFLSLRGNMSRSVFRISNAFSTRSLSRCKRQLKIVQNRQMKSVHPYLLWGFAPKVNLAPKIYQKDPFKCKAYHGYDGKRSLDLPSHVPDTSSNRIKQPFCHARNP